MTTAGLNGQPHGYTGTQKLETLQEKAARAAFPNLMQIPKQINEGLDELTRDFQVLRDVLVSKATKELQRETSLDVIEEDTNSAPLTNTEGKRFDCLVLYGVPANSLGVHTVVGTDTQISINGSKWIPLRQDMTYANMVINNFRLRKVAGAAGTARLIVGYYAGLG